MEPRVDPFELLDLEARPIEQHTHRARVVPGNVLRVDGYLVVPQAEPELLDVERIRRRDHELGAALEVTSSARQEPPWAGEVLDQIADDDHVERASEVEVLGVGYLDVVSELVERHRVRLEDVEADELLRHVVDLPVQPVIAQFERRHPGMVDATDVEHGSCAATVDDEWVLR